MPTSSFLVELGDGKFDEIISYGTLCKCIEDLEDDNISPEEKVWTFKDVIGHQGPLKKSHKDYKGSMYTMFYCYGMMVLKRMNHSKWSLKMTQ